MAATLFVSLPLTSLSQTTFNIRWHYDAPTVGINVWENDNGLFIQGAHLDSSDLGISFGYLNKRDLNGDDLGTTFFGSTNEQYGYTRGENTAHGDSIIVLTQCELMDTSRAAVLWFDPDGELFRKRFYKSPYAELDGDEFGTFHDIGGIKVNDLNGSVLFCFGPSNDVTGNDVYFYSINSDGDILWTFPIATELGYEDCFSFELIAGDAIANVNQSGDGENFNRIYRFDSLGQPIDTTEVSIDFGIVWDQLSDENGITCASARSFWPFGNQALVFQMDEDGELNWELLLGEDFYFFQEFKQIFPTNDGNYVLMGRYYDSDPEDPDANGDENWYGWLIKISPDGQLIWDRKFSSISSVMDHHTFQDMKPTSDGGYMMCGTVTDNWISETQITPHQQAWLIKTDEHGCVVPGCHVGVEGYEKQQHFLFGPNPVSGILNVYLSDVTLTNDAMVFIYDMTGIVVESFAVRNRDVTYMLDVSGLAAASYVITLESGGRILQSETLIVK